MTILKKSFFLFILFIQVCFGQKTFKIKEGELSFINLEKGIYIKKNNTYYQLRLEDVDNYKKLSNGIVDDLSRLNLEQIEKIKKDTTTIMGSDVVKFDFKKLDTQRFTTQNDVNQDDNYRLYKLNKNFFAISILEDSIQRPRNQYLFNYVILDFGNNKKIIYHPEGYIIPTKEKIKFLFKKGDLNDSFQNYKSEIYKKLQATDLDFLTGADLRLNSGFYKIDTLKNKQLRITNIYNQTLINKTFDSIVSSGSFIAGYKNNEIDFYNFTFQNLNLKNVKAFCFSRSFSIQIIQNNELRRINLIGETFKTSDVNSQMSYSHFFEDLLCKFKITKKNDCFYLESNNINSVTDTFLGYNRLFKIRDSDQLETVEFLDDPFSAFIINSEMRGFTIKKPIILYTKLKNGKFNLNSLDYLLAEELTQEILAFNNTLPKNLDSISPEWGQTYLIEKNGLFTIYPLIKEIKLKKIEEFQGNFARFELPNGQKGWLDIKGKEYFDE